MIDNWVKKGLALAIILLFISVSCSSVISVENKTPVINTQSVENKSYVDPNIHLKRTDLPILKRSFNYYKSSNDYDAEIGKVMEQIINLIESKGEVDSKDVENILKNCIIAPFNVYANCKIIGDACGGIAYTIPGILWQTIVGMFYFNWRIEGLSLFLFWKTYTELDCSELDIEITVGSDIFTTHHTGSAFGFYGSGDTRIRLCYDYYHGYYGKDYSCDISGRALIAFVKT